MSSDSVISGNISIAGMDKAAVLAALYNAARRLGLGFLHYGPKSATVEDARAWLDANPSAYFDYVKGRVMKVDLSRDTFSPLLYDRDNGAGAAWRALEAAGLCATQFKE